MFEGEVPIHFGSRMIFSTVSLADFGCAKEMLTEKNRKIKVNSFRIHVL